MTDDFIIKPDEGHVHKDGTVKFPALTIDWELYGTYLEDSDLTDAQKREFIETLWNIAVAFVDLGFGIHPVQQAHSGDCGQNQDLVNFVMTDSGAVVESDIKSKSNFNEVADRSSDPSPIRSQK